MATDTRERILTTTAELFRRQGYNGTGVKQIVGAARAPFGSVYHHFPGGKEQLGAEVIRTAGTMYGVLVLAILESEPDPVVAVRESFRLAGVHLEESGWQDACPIATVALEVASVNEPMRLATHEVFESWVAGLSAYFARAASLAAAEARELALGLIVALEGAFVLARAGRTVEPLHAAGELVATRLESLLTASGDAPSGTASRSRR